MALKRISRNSCSYTQSFNGCLICNEQNIFVGYKKLRHSQTNTNFIHEKKMLTWHLGTDFCKIMHQINLLRLCCWSMRAILERKKKVEKKKKISITAILVLKVLKMLLKLKNLQKLGYQMKLYRNSQSVSLTIKHIWPMLENKSSSIRSFKMTTKLALTFQWKVISLDSLIQEKNFPQITRQ